MTCVSPIGDSKLLRIALENLVGNVWKYSSKREETLIAFGKTVFNENPRHIWAEGEPGIGATFFFTL